MEREEKQALYKALDILAEGLLAAPEVKARYRKHVAKIHQMSDEKRKPTKKEWDKLNEEGAKLSEEIHAAVGARTIA